MDLTLQQRRPHRTTSWSARAGVVALALVVAACADADDPAADPALGAAPTTTWVGASSTTAQTPGAATVAPNATVLWIVDGDTIDVLFEHWILGKDALQKGPRWSVIRDVLHWVD